MGSTSRISERGRDDALDPMKPGRFWSLIAVIGVLSLWYAWSYTEWIRPEPIEIIPQFRPLPKGQSTRTSTRVSDITAEVNSGGSGSESAKPIDVTLGNGHRPKSETARAEKPVRATATRSRASGVFGGGRDLQPFIFSLDGKYRLTSLKVTEVSPTNPTPRIVWSIRSKYGSPPTDAIIYGRAPDTLVPLTAGNRPDKLVPGRTYTLFLEAGRRRGQKSFIVPQEAEPAEPPTPDDGDYKPEKDLR